jgi:hypothetical protein
VIVYETDGGHSVVEAMAPLAVIGLAGDAPELRAVAEEADSRLRRALAAVESAR